MIEVSNRKNDNLSVHLTRIPPALPLHKSKKKKNKIKIVQWTMELCTQCNGFWFTINCNPAPQLFIQPIFFRGTCYWKHSRQENSIKILPPTLGVTLTKTHNISPFHSFFFKFYLIPSRFFSLFLIHLAHRKISWIPRGSV